MAESCYARIENQELIAGNALIERRWRIIGGKFFAASFLDKTSGRQWLTGVAQKASLLPPAVVNEKDPILSLELHRGVWRAGEAQSLVAQVISRGKKITLMYRFEIFANLPGISVQLVMPDAGLKTQSSVNQANDNAASGIEVDQPASQTSHDDVNIIECLALAPSGLTLREFELHDQTDHHNTLVHEREYLLHPAERGLMRHGNLFAIEDDATGDGLVWLKHAPLEHARPVRDGADLAFSDHHILFMGHGATDAEGYLSTVIAYRGGKAGRAKVLHDLQRHYRVINSQRDGRIISNTWGDRNRDSRICESFVLQEIDAGAKIGIEVTQIDDGWQKGKTANSASAGGVWNGFWAADENFWLPHPERFPNGLAPVVQAAAKKGMHVGLWFAPDSSDDFKNYLSDAEALLKLHREHGVCYFKIDGVKAHSKLSERRLLAMFSKVIEESAGKVTFDLDVTAEVRPGYFGAMCAGPLFLENRYTDWRNYYPHATLRNLWMLSWVIDPWRLRIEFLNPHRKQETYGDENLAPGRYDITWLFASVMLSNPLAWMEVSNLPAADIEKLAPLVAMWKTHRTQMMTNHTLPIGHQPNGYSWSGFLNYGDDSAYVLMFRGNAKTNTYAEPLMIGSASGAEILGGSGHVAINGKGQLEIYLPSERSFIWAKLMGFGKKHRSE